MVRTTGRGLRLGVLYVPRINDFALNHRDVDAVAQRAESLRRAVAALRGLQGGAPVRATAPSPCAPATVRSGHPPWHTPPQSAPQRPVLL